MQSDLKSVIGRYLAFVAAFAAAVVVLWFFGAELFSVLLAKSRSYTPPQFLTWLSLLSSLCLSIAFCVIPFSLFRIVRRRPDVPFGWMVLCVAGFLFLTGITAFLGLLHAWFHGPILVWILVVTHVVAAFLSIGTLFIIRALVPRILEIPTRAQFLAVHKDLLRVETSAEEKDKLLAAVSHELRNPLAPLLACLTQLEARAEALADPEVHDCAQVLRKNILKEAELVNGLIDRLEIPGTRPADAPLVASESNAELRPARLLIVEDHLDTLRIFARMLRRHGFEVQEASTVSEAVAAARAGDFLLSDIALPDGNGCDLMRQLSSLGIPGIAISGFGTAKDRERYRMAGFAEFFVKPVDVTQVVHAIGRVIRGSPGTYTGQTVA